MSAKSPSTRIVIVAAVDRSSASDDVLHTSSSLAQLIAGAELHFVHVVQPIAADMAATPPVTETMVDEGRAFLGEATKSAASRFNGRIAGHLVVGQPAHEVLQLASNLGADLLVVGTHGKKAIERVLAGSVSEQIVRRAPCAVLVARPKESASAEPEVEPPCPACLKAQQQSRGDELWCARHASRHAHARLHYETPPSFAVGSMLIRP